MNPTTASAVASALDEIEMIPSPHHYRGRPVLAIDEDVDTLVLHYTAGRGDERPTARLFANPRRQASAHYCVGRTGGIVQCVSLADAAWHAGDGGKARIPDARQLAKAGPGELIPLAKVRERPKVHNCRSVGIEICNRGWAPRGPNPYATARHRNPASTSTRWESFSTAQLDSLLWLVEKLAAAVPTLRWVCGHEDSTHKDTLGAPGGKLDPGPLFPWEMLRSTGLRRVFYDFTARGWRVEAPNGAA
jgi:N-acetyl-anhydromuramyl-L-alanine amidase AmpD